MRPPRLLVLALLLVAGTGLARAQPADGFTLAVRGVPLQEALQELARLTQIDLVYTSALVARKTSYCADENSRPEALLACVLDGSGLDYVRSSSGAYILIPAPQQPPQRGHVAGRVVDDATGLPLPYATVLLADAGAGTTTDGNGLFQFGGVLPGTHRLVVSHLGYATLVDSVWIAPGARERRHMALRPTTLVIEPVLIDGLAQQMPSATLGSGAADAAALTALAGAATPDVARTAARLPGIDAQQPLADLHIQGGASGEHLTLLDGMPIRNPVSLGRHFGAFSPLALDGLTVRKAGVVAATHDLGRTPGLDAAASLDPVSLNARVSHRWQRPAGPIAVMAAARTSVWTAYQDPGIRSLLNTWSGVDPLLAARWLDEPIAQTRLQTQRRLPAVRFSDLHLAARVPLRPFRVLTASAYRGANHLASDQTTLVGDGYADAVRLYTDDAYDWLNGAAQLGHSWLLGARAVATLQARGSWHASSYGYSAYQAASYQAASTERQSTYIPRSDERHRIRELALEGTYSYSFAPRVLLEGGLTLERVVGRFALGSGFVAPFTHRLATWRQASYITGRLGLGPATTLEPGLRLTWTHGEVYGEPRLALRHDRAWRGDGHLALRVAGGLYRQFINQYELSSAGATTIVPSVLFWLPVGPDLTPPKVVHAAAEVLLAPGPHWSLDVETYLKLQPHLLMVDYAALVDRPAPEAAAPAEALAQPGFVRTTEGHAYGGSLRLRYAGERFRPRLRYSYSRAVRTHPWPSGARRTPVPWNTPHRVVLDADTDLRPGLALYTGWTGAWGRAWGLRRFYYDYLLFESSPVSFAPFDLTRPEAQRLPPAYRLDLGLTLTHDGTLGRVQARVFVMNALDRANVYDRSLERLSTGALHLLDRALPGRHLVLSIRLDR